VYKSFEKPAYQVSGRKALLLLSAGVAALLTWGGAARAADTDNTANAGDGSYAVAYNAAGGGIETVTVTARHREEKAQDVPISLSVVKGDTLESNGITSSIKLDQLIPSLTVLSTNPRNTSILVRGLGANVALTNDGLESGVGVYVDGVLYSRPAASTFDLPDITSIEELRGPQGTLYGKNAIAGALNITTLAPSSSFEARGSVSIGDFAYKNESGTVSGPLTDDGKLGFRVSVHDTDRNGFITNVTANQKVNDYHDYGVRTQFLYEPSDDLSLKLIADYDRQKHRDVVQVFTGLVTTLSNGTVVPRNFTQRSAAAGYTPLAIDPFARQTDENSSVFIKMEQGGVSLQADWDLGGYTLTSISAYRFWNWTPSNDVDLTSLSITTQGRIRDEERQATQELRITSPSDGPIEYTGGLYYYWEQDDGFSTFSYGKDAPIWLLGADTPVLQAALNGFRTDSKSIPRINSYGAYAQATWHVLPSVDFTGGFRYTYEYKTGGFSQVASGADLSGLTPVQQATANGLRNAFGAVSVPYSIHASNNLLGGLATLTYKVSDDINAYASYSHGEKSAGLNLANLPSLSTALLVVAPELIDNYEVGFKSTLFDGRVTFNADAFWADDTNYQTTIANLNVTPIVTYIANIPAVRSRGFESDIVTRPIDNLTLHFSTAYTDAIYVKYPNAPAPFEDYFSPAAPTVFNPSAVRDLSGRPLPLVAKWVISAGGEYDQPLGGIGLGGASGYVGADVNYRSSNYSAANDSICSLIRAHEVTNLRVGIRTDDGHWDLSLWARNAFDTKYYQTSGVAAFNSGAVAALLGDPRTVGVTLHLAY